MIEVEIKFPLINGNEQRLVADARLISKSVVKDIYYDDAKHSLTLADYWLRKRNGKFELKLPANPSAQNAEYVARRYTELTDEKDILKALELDGDDITKAIANNYQPIAELATTRHSYKNGQFRIDIDRTNFGYSIGEIEMLVKGPTHTKTAERELENYLHQHNIAYSHGHIGKVAHYIQRHNPTHFHQLVEAGVVGHEAKAGRHNDNF